MLSRIVVNRFATRRSLLTWRASIAPRQIISSHFAQTCSHRRLLSDSPLDITAASDRRRWVLLNSRGCYRPDDSSLVAGDANTVAESRTSSGQRVRVSLGCAAPPASSYLYYDFPESSPYLDDSIRVVGAHGGFVLLENHNSRSCSVEEDYFVYTPAGTLRPPSMSRLPVPEFPTKPDSVPASYFDPSGRRPSLESGGIGLLRRGKNDDLLVVHVDLWYDIDARWLMAVFCVLHPGMRRWELMEPVPISQDGPLCCFRPRKHVICVGDRFLCWVWHWSSFLLCDMADEARPKVRDVPLPPEVRRCRYGDDYDSVRFRRMGVAGDTSVRFVSIHPQCCSIERYEDDPECCGCGYSDKKECWHPRHVFTIKTWTMGLSVDEPLEWVEDGEIDGEDIWALPGYEGLPQAIPEWPVVCLDEANNVICFLVSNYHFTRDVIKKKWMVQLNVTTKTLLSVVPFDDCKYYHLPAQIQYKPEETPSSG